MKSARTVSSEVSLGRWLAPVLDGRYRWGSYTVSVTRYGSVNHRLVLYPPGMSAGQRRRVRLWRGWMLLGIVGALGVFLGLAEAGVSSLVIMAACVSFYLLGAVVVGHHAGPIRREVLELTAARSALVSDLGHTAECRYLAGLSAMLTAADESLDHGRSSAADHELIWSAVYAEAQHHLRTA